MGKKWVSYTVTILIFTFMVFAAIWSAVKQHNYSGVGALGMLALTGHCFFRMDKDLL